MGTRGPRQKVSCSWIEQEVWPDVSIPIPIPLLARRLTRPFFYNTFQRNEKEEGRGRGSAKGASTSNKGRYGKREEG